MKTILATLLFASLANLHGAVNDSLKTLQSVGREGAGNEAAGAAWKDVVNAGPQALTGVLAVAGKGTPVADNWLRLAADVIVDNAVRAGQPLPLTEVAAFIADTSHAAAGRRLAFDILQQADRAQADALEPSLIQDPVQELRRGAVQRVIAEAKAQNGEAAKGCFLRALEAVRDEDQTKIITEQLSKLGVKVDLPRHFGFLMKWNVIGPFDNTGRKGFDTAFPPEKEIKLDAAYAGKDQQVKWQPLESADDYGKLDFNKPFGMLKETTAYAMATFDSPEDREAEIRLGCKDAWKVWLNGKPLFGRDEYHRGQQMDQYKLKCRLKKGANTVLVKCCQNEQKETWTVEWEFQLRICDSAGTAILAAGTDLK